MEELPDSSDPSSSSDSPASPFSSRASIRRIRKQEKKAEKRRLAVAKCIFIDTQVEGQTVKTLLDGGSEINCVSRKLVERLQLPPSTINEGAVALGRKIQTFRVYFLSIEIADRDGHSRFFEESVLAVNMKEDLLLGMPWSRLANPMVDWAEKTIEWRKELSLLPTSRRVEFISPEDFADEVLASENSAYLLEVCSELEGDFEHVYVTRQPSIRAVRLDNELAKVLRSCSLNPD